MIDHLSHRTDHLFSLVVNGTVETTVANDKLARKRGHRFFFLSNDFMPEMILILQMITEPTVNLVVSNLIFCFCFIDYAKAFDCVDHNKLWKILKDGNTRPPDLPLEKSVCSSGSQLEVDMEQQTGSK